MENNEPNMHAYTGVMMKKAHLDWEMECLQTKIKCKNEENSKLENQISERKNELEKLRKSVNTSCEREEKVKNNINMLRNSRTISEGLLMSMKHQLRTLEEKRNDTKNVRKNILEKYSKLFESHTKIYSNLPWVKKINELKTSVKSRQIHLDILKMEYSSIKRKNSLFHKIQDKRKLVAITRLAKSLVARNNLQKEVEDLISKQKTFQSRIILLEEEKIKFQEKIDLKVKEALDEARGRVVKKHVGESIAEKHTIVTAPSDKITSLGTNLKPTNESIFSRLGLSVLPSMKRLLTPSSRVLNRVNSLMEEQSKKDVSGTEISGVQEKSLTSEVQKEKQTMEEQVRVLERTHVLKEDHPKKKYVPVTEKINRAEDKSLMPEVKKDKQMMEGKALKRPSTSLSNVSEKIPHLMEVTQKNKTPAEESVHLGQEKCQPSPNNGCVSNNEKSEITQQATASEPTSASKLTILTEETENKRNTNQNVDKNLKNKEKKDSNSESALSVQISENPKSNIPGNDQNAVMPEESLRDDDNELRSNIPEKHVTFVNPSQEIPTEKENTATNETCGTSRKSITGKKYNK
ncbi:unnamed protein product [Nezara viridula]|uniref:Uncharacterized protein n=1 Tax=Nezara viridula TaxID=85310 RepID=A0A9P0HNP2_NEZVI|nr:unnamed protein product [Nezara viridula]